MKLFLLTQTENTGMYTYNSLVVIASSEDEAKIIHPLNGRSCIKDPWSNKCWASSPNNVIVTYLGEADPNVKLTIVCKSYSQ